MNTTWIDVREVLLEDGARQKQRPAVGIGNAVEVGATALRTTAWVYVPLSVSTVHAVRLGYRYKRFGADDRSRIRRIELIELGAPGQAKSVRHAEDVAPNAEAHGYYTVTTPALFSPLTFLLGIEVEIVDSRDWFVIGPIGVEDHANAIPFACPLDFGAVGDGVADDTDALHAALAYAVANEVPLDLASRTYRYARTLHAKPRQVNEAGVTLRNGALRFDGAGAAVLVDKQSTIYTPVHMQGITITGGSEVGLDLGKAHRSELVDVTVSGFETGMRLRGCYFTSFLNCHARNNGVNLDIRAFEQTNGAVRANDNKFWGCTFVGSTAFASLQMPLGEDVAGTNNTFYGCDFEHSAQHSVYLGSAHATSFIDCRFEAAFVNPPDSAAPFSMIELAGGEQTRIIECNFPGMPTTKEDDCLIRVGPGHRGPLIMGCIFPGGLRWLIDPNNHARLYGNWPIPDRFGVPPHTHD